MLVGEERHVCLLAQMELQTTSPVNKLQVETAVHIHVNVWLVPVPDGDYCFICGTPVLLKV